MWFTFWQWFHIHQGVSRAQPGGRWSSKVTVPEGAVEHHSSCAQLCAQANSAKSFVV